jgi:Uma2 family endonuclease
MSRSVSETQMWRLSVEQYHQMIRSGILSEDDPVELLQGWLITKMSKNPPHSSATRFLSRELERLIPQGWYVDSQEPITTADSEPEPDIAILRGSEENYTQRHPRPEDVGLVAEVADSTLTNDRGIKLEVYAQAGILEYWIVNLGERQLEVYTNPDGKTYQNQAIYNETMFVPLNLDGQLVGNVEVSKLLV